MPVNLAGRGAGVLEEGYQVGDEVEVEVLSGDGERTVRAPLSERPQ